MNPMNPVIEINPEQTRNSLAILEAELMLFQQILDARNRERMAASELAGLQMEKETQGGLLSQNKTVELVAKMHLVARARWDRGEAEEGLDRIKIARHQAQVAILKAKLEETERDPKRKSRLLT